jgi:hypothetical protein
MLQEFLLSVDQAPSSLILQPGRPTRLDPGSCSLLCPICSHQLEIHRCLGQPDLDDSGDFILCYNEGRTLRPLFGAITSLCRVGAASYACPFGPCAHESDRDQRY